MSVRASIAVPCYEQYHESLGDVEKKKQFIRARM